MKKKDGMKYLACFSIPHPHAGDIRRLMHRVAGMTHTKPLCEKLDPHITIYRPLIGVDECAVMNIIEQEVQRARSTMITTDRLSHFETEHIVLPVRAALGVTMLWVDISRRLSKLAGGDPDQYTFDNTLHVSVASKTTPRFKQAWPQVKKIEVEPMHIKLEEIVLYWKVHGMRWEPLRAFPFPK